MPDKTCDSFFRRYISFMPKIKKDPDRESRIRNEAIVDCRPEELSDDTINYSHILDQLKDASAFDLHRLRSAIGVMMQEPDRCRKVMTTLVEGQEIEYFEPTENRMIPARVLKIKRTKVLVEHLENDERWNIPCYMINFDRKDTRIVQSKTAVGMNRNELAVGDRVGFRGRNQREEIGQIAKLNPKMAVVQTKEAKWRVRYEALYPILDVEGHEDANDPLLIEI